MHHARVAVRWCVIALVLSGCSTEESGRETSAAVELTPPPAEVLARVPERLAMLKDEMTQDEILEALGLGPWLEYLGYHGSLAGGFGGFTTSCFFDDPAYGLSITTRPSGKTEVAFKHPDSAEWVTRELRSAPEDAWMPEPSSHGHAGRD